MYVDCLVWMAVSSTHLGLQRVAFIKQEHTFFLACVKIAFSLKVASSLVFGDHFIHSYHFVCSEEFLSFLILNTYSRHGNACYHWHVFFPIRLDNVIQKTMDYLTVSCASYISTDTHVEI